MKISNETKVGALTAIAIVVLVLGFNYLKGKNLTARNDKLYAIFPAVRGLAVSNAVFINGLEVGKVAELEETDKNLTGILVTLTLNKDINIPDNSIATINSELLSSNSLDIVLGDSRTYVKDGDTLQTKANVSVMGELTKSINPAINNVNKTLVSLDDLIRRISAVVDPNTKNNLQNIVANLTTSSRSLQQLMDAERGILARSLNNVELITANLARNNERINTTLGNLEQTSTKLAALKLEEAIQSLKNSLARIENAVKKVDSKDGTLGLLLNDRQLYDEIRETNRSLNTLLDDLRVNPKRYVSVSVFGRKDKKVPLMSPLYDTIPIK